MRVYIDAMHMLEASRILGRDKPFTYDCNSQRAIYEVDADEYEAVKDYAQTEADLRHASQREAFFQAERERRETIRRDTINFLRQLLDPPQQSR